MKEKSCSCNICQANLQASNSISHANIHHVPTQPTQEKESSHLLDYKETLDRFKAQFGTGESTQDTESWEKDFCEIDGSVPSKTQKKYIDFIKHKKQEWHFEGWESGQKIVNKKARTQGAEAAVVYIDEHWTPLGYGSRSAFDSVLEEAKKV